MNWFDERVETRYDAGADLNTSLIWIFPAHTEMIGEAYERHDHSLNENQWS